MKLDNIFNSLKWESKILISGNIYLYRIFANYIAKRKELFVSSNTDIVIEGFPRSGNTFAVALFKVTQGNINIACHRHEIGHIKLASTLKKPIIILIRNPEDAVTSLYLRENVNLRVGFKYYIYFYTNLLKKDIEKNILFINFNELINNPINILKKTSFKFNIDLTIPENLNIEKIKTEVIYMDRKELNKNIKDEKLDLKISLPSNSKNFIKKKIKLDIEKSNKLKTLLIEANEIYHKIIDENL